MKKLNYFIILVIICSCNKNKLQEQIKVKKDLILEENRIKVKNKKNNIESKLVNDSLLIYKKDIENIKLIGLKIIDSLSDNSAIKFGFDIEKGCYSCDLTLLKIKNNKLIMENFCNSKDIVEIDILQIKTNSYKIDLITKNNTLSFIKKDKIPIFELVIKENNIENILLNNYFTTEFKLSYFKIHDCGDFEG